MSIVNVKNVIYIFILTLIMPCAVYAGRVKTSVYYSSQNVISTNAVNPDCGVTGKITAHNVTYTRNGNSGWYTTSLSFRSSISAKKKYIKDPIVIAYCLVSDEGGRRHLYRYVYTNDRHWDYYHERSRGVVGFSDNRVEVDKNTVSRFSSVNSKDDFKFIMPPDSPSFRLTLLCYRFELWSGKNLLDVYDTSTASLVNKLGLSEEWYVWMRHKGLILYDDKWSRM